MKQFKEGAKRLIRVLVKRLSGSGAIAVTTPQYRILNASRAVVAGYDWQAATWDAAANEISALFDSTQAALATPGHYFMQFRAVIGVELYEIEITIKLGEWGP